MKIQIDTKNKTISVLEDVRMDELMDTINRLFPDNAWKGYKLEQVKETQYIPSTPIIIDDRWWRRQNPYPWITWTTPDININDFDYGETVPRLQSDIVENFSYYSDIEEGNIGNPDVFLLEVK